MTTAAKTSTAVVRTAADKREALSLLLEKAKPQLVKVLPKHLTIDRLLKIALANVSRQPELLACTPQSILLSIMQATELGLEVGGVLGEGYLIPFKNLATFVPGYRGLIKLARQGGVRRINAEVAHVNDVQADIHLGTNARIDHVPLLDGDPGPIKFVYAIAHFDGEDDYQFVWLTPLQIDAIRKRSKAASDGPWVTDYEEMAKKTAIRRLAKLLPLCAELQRAVEIENAAEQGIVDPVYADVFEDASEQEPAKSRADNLKDALRANGATGQVVADADGVVFEAKVAT